MSAGPETDPMTILAWALVALAFLYCAARLIGAGWFKSKHQFDDSSNKGKRHGTQTP